MTDYYEYAIPQLVKLLGARFKDYRLRSNMTQKEVSEQSGLTVTTIHKFESGAADNISLATFLLLDQRAQLLVGQVVRGFLCLMRCTFFSFLIR